jgi:hypothetical protein
MLESLPNQESAHPLFPPQRWSGPSIEGWRKTPKLPPADRCFPQRVPELETNKLIIFNVMEKRRAILSISGKKILARRTSVLLSIPWFQKCICWQQTIRNTGVNTLPVQPKRKHSGGYTNVFEQ